MSSDDNSDKAYEEDPRTACQYGSKCYQKNELHRKKYKHPPKGDQKDRHAHEKVSKHKKRKNEDPKEETDLPTAKSRKTDKARVARESHDMSPSPERDSVTSISEKDDVVSSNGGDLEAKGSPVKESSGKLDSSIEQNLEEASSETPNISNEKSPSKKPPTPSDSPSKPSLTKKSAESKSENEKETSDEPSLSTGVEEEIHKKFQLKMPDDFYKFYDFCSLESKVDPCNALKAVDLILVGPYDVLSGKLSDYTTHDKKEYYCHWRYYFDPPEFETILKGNDKDQFHIGYWRDEDKEKPVFVAKNSANLDCSIVRMSENVFGAVDAYLEERLKGANPFDRMKIVNLQKRLKRFAKEHKLTLERQTTEMRERHMKVVAKTFHGAGIVVPYDRKTQVGYRELAATDSVLNNILKRVDDAADKDERDAAMTDIEEIVRLAIIAADECDFGTCLELGHDLFSSGSVHVQKAALQMLDIAYTHLQRPLFLEIAKAHLANRKKGCDLSIV